MSNNFHIVEAEVIDVAQIQSIYEYYVLNSIATFEEIPPSIEEMVNRLRTVLESGGVWFVAKENSTDTILGYAYFSQFRDRPGYRFTVEVHYYFQYLL